MNIFEMTNDFFTTIEHAFSVFTLFRLTIEKITSLKKKTFF